MKLFHFIFFLFSISYLAFAAPVRLSARGDALLERRFDDPSKTVAKRLYKDTKATLLKKLEYGLDEELFKREPPTLSRLSSIASTASTASSASSIAPPIRPVAAIGEAVRGAFRVGTRVVAGFKGILGVGAGRRQ